VLKFINRSKTGRSKENVSIDRLIGFRYYYKDNTPTRPVANLGERLSDVIQFLEDLSYQI
jgi:hypothetical protein